MNLDRPDLATLEPMQAPSGPQLTLLSSLVSALVADAETAHAFHITGKRRGPGTGLEGLDEALGGFLAPGLHLIQSAPGSGKTALCLQAAASCGFPALYVTAEMPVLELFRRTIARETGTYLGRIRSGELTPAEVQRLAVRTAQAVPALAFLDATLGYTSPDLIRQTAHLLRARFETEQVLIVIDALQVWARGARTDEAQTEYEAVSGGVEAARALAAELVCPVLSVSHRNRQGNREGSKGKAAGMHAGKGSGDLEYAAETVLELTPGDYTPDRSLRTVTLSIHKNRHGESGFETDLQFEGRLQRFTEV